MPISYILLDPSLLSPYGGLYVGVRGLPERDMLSLRDGMGGLEVGGNSSAVVAVAVVALPEKKTLWVLEESYDYSKILPL